MQFEDPNPYLPRHFVARGRYPAALNGVWAKMQRGEEHLEAYEDAVKIFAKNDACKYAPECDLDTGDKVWRIYETPKTPSIRVALMIGDCVQNFRTALDHLAWQLVIRAGGEPTNRTAFPLESTDERYSRRAPSKLAGMSPDMKSRIESCQPCHGVSPYRNKVFGWLEDLNNIDKHRYIHITTAATMGGLWSYALPARLTSTIYEGPLENGTILARVPKEYMDVEFGFFVDLAFGADGPAAGEAVFQTLIGFREIVSTTIEGFQNTFFQNSLVQN